MTTKLSTLESRWLDALVSAKHTFTMPQVRELWNRTQLIENPSLSTATSLGASEAGVCYMFIRPVSDLPEIEARELLLFVAARLALLKFGFSGPWVGPRDLFNRLGCHYENLYTVSERWRVMHMTRNLATLPYAGLENRPQCKICSGRVATGAGWTPSDDAVVSNPDLGTYRPDLHHECKNFALTVLLPQHRAAAAERAKAETARIDK